jgi:hypothetical protein
MFHKEGTLTITMSEPLVLQGCERKGETLWKVSAPQTTRKKQEEISNVYNLPSISQTIKYHHTSAGYPVEDSWIKGIHAGNYTTWPGLTSAAVQKHFPESDEMQKGHMKWQPQGVRSTKNASNDHRGRGYNSRLTNNASTKEDERRIHQDPQRKQNNVHGPTRLIPSHIEQRKSVHNGVSRS